MKIISLVSLIIISCQGVYASSGLPRPNQNNTLRPEEFNQFMLSGRLESRKIDISKNVNFYVKVEKVSLNGNEILQSDLRRRKLYQYFEIKDGGLYSIYGVVNEKGIIQYGYVTSLIQDILTEISKISFEKHLQKIPGTTRIELLTGSLDSVINS